VFVGTFEHTLDDKGRVVLPAGFRLQLGEHGVLSKLDACLALWTPPAFEEVRTYMQEQARAGKLGVNALRRFASLSHPVSPDGQGRISIPAHLRSLVGIERDVVITGNFNRIELWTPATWQGITEEADASLAAAVAELGI
jgi:MraZ protein